MTDELRIERVIDAPPDVVFDAFTTDGGQDAFYGTDDPGWIVESRVRPARGRPLDGHVRPLAGPPLPPPERLRGHRPPAAASCSPRPSVRPDGSGFDFSVEFTFEEQDGRTRMTVIQSGFPTAELRDEHGRGVPNAFARLERAIRASK